jgi:hypothetical protein
MPDDRHRRALQALRHRAPANALIHRSPSVSDPPALQQLPASFAAVAVRASAGRPIAD